MSYYYHKINSVQDEANLLKRIINLETQVRAKREQERIASNSESEKYARIFEPITQSMKTLHTIAGSGGTSSSSQRSGGQSANSNNTIKIAKKKEKEEEEDEDSGLLFCYDPKEDSSSISTHVNRDDHDDDDDNSDNESSLLHQALSQVSKGQRDDGVYGINWNKRTIGGKEFTVKNGNILQVQVGSGEKMEFKITDINVWKLLLYQNPYDKVSTETSEGEPTQAVQQYQEIADALNLIDYAKHHLKSDAYKKRKKYKILSIRKQQGSGFLFSIQIPSSFSNKKVKKKTKKEGTGIAKVKKHQYNRKQLFKPSTIVIPSDKKGLLSALIKATAEMKAGNSSMRNLVVPLEQEAKRRGILPIEYENDIHNSSNATDEEDNLNWIYA